MSPAARRGGGSQRLSGRGRALAALTVVGLHAGGAAALLSVRAEPSLDAPQPLQVQWIATRAVPPIAVPPPPTPPKPARLLATPKPSPSAMAAPPAEVEPSREPRVEVPDATRVAAAPEAAAAPTPTAAPSATEALPIVPPSFVAAYLNNPAPGYPQAAKQRGESGQVLLRVRVCVDGHAGDVRIEQSSGSSRLDAAARDVVFRKWRFVPAKRGEEAIEAWVLVPIVFALKG